jgi:hypothetical protein
MVYLIKIELVADGLPSERPELTGVFVAQKQVFAGIIFDQVLFPSGNSIV